MTAGKPWLSVLIPVYNVETWLRACVESVLAQADTGVEILLVDDASTDGSAALMQRLADEHPGRLQLLHHQRNGGLSAARNTLLAEARGDYVWFLDSDDLLLPGAIAGLLAVVRRAAPDLVLCDFQVLRERMRLKHRLRGESHRRTFEGPARSRQTDRSLLLQGLFMTGKLHTWSKIGRRALWGEDLRFPPGRYYEDMYTSPELALRANSFYYVPECWVGYRQRDGSILATLNEQKLDHMMESLVGLPQRLDAMRPALSGQARFAIAHYIARSYVSAARFLARRVGPQAVAHCHAQMLASLPLPPAELLRRYLARGWLWRAARLSYWLRRGAGAQP